MEEGQGVIRAQLGAQLTKLRRGEVADVLMGVVGQASTLGDSFLPHLVEAIVTGGPLMRAESGTLDLEPIERRVDRLTERIDRQLGRLATGAALMGVAIVAAALLLAILPRPTDVLVGYDLVALIFAVGVAAFLIMAVRGWRRDDDAWLAALHDELGPRGRR